MTPKIETYTDRYFDDPSQEIEVVMCSNTPSLYKTTRNKKQTYLESKILKYEIKQRTSIKQREAQDKKGSHGPKC